MEGEKEIFQLQPLRIQAGWMINYNNFTEYDPEIHPEEASTELSEDLLQLSTVRGNLIIDLGWYPGGDSAGNYLLLLVKDFDWETPLEKLAGRSKKDVVDKIEKWVCYDYYSKYL